MDTSRTVFDRTVRAACGFESEYVRDDALSVFAVRMRVHDMRVLIAVRGANRKTSRGDFFACFSWPNIVRAKALRYAVVFHWMFELFDTPYSRGTSGEGLRLESALPGAPRTADITDYKGAAFVSKRREEQILRFAQGLTSEMIPRAAARTGQKF